MKRLLILTLLLMNIPLFSRDVLKGELLWAMQRQVTQSTFDVLITQNMINDAGGSLVLTNTGTYGLAENITFTGSTGISIEVSNILLDLNGHTLEGLGAGNTGIAIQNNNISNVVVRNGSISNCQGVLVTAGDNVTISFVTIENLMINVGTTTVGNAGISLTRTSVTGFVNDIKITNCDIRQGNPGINIASTIAFVTVQQCQTNFSGGDGITSAGVSCIFQNCISHVNTGAGFNFTTSADIERCVAGANLGNGFTIAGNFVLQDCIAEGNLSGFAISGSRAALRRCIAFNNSADGFFNASLDVSIVSCEAFSNTIGFHDTTAGTGTALFFNNLSYVNGTNYSATTETIPAIVLSTAVTTATGFWSNVAG